MKTWSCFDPWVRADNRTNNNAGASLGASVAPRCPVARCRTVLLTFIARTAVLRSVIANVHVECYRQSCSRLCQASDSVQIRFLLRHHTHAHRHSRPLPSSTYDSSPQPPLHSPTTTPSH